jgi:hypothetical protein
LSQPLENVSTNVRGKNRILTVNKTASNAVYLVVAVMLIVAASTQVTPVQSVSTLLACTAAQLQSGTLLVLRNLGSRTRPSHSSLVYGDFSKAKVQIFTKNSPEIHLHRFTIPAVIPIGVEASDEMCSASDDISNSGRCFSPASLRITSGIDILLAPFTALLRVTSGQDAKYRFAYLKRDLVYVRSKI